MKDATRKLLEKADRALRAAEILLGARDAEFAIGRAYYAMLYAAEALLVERGLTYGKHSRVHAAFGQHFIETGILDPKYHRWLLDAFDERLEGDYDFEITVTPVSAATRIEHAREFVQTVREHLQDAC